MTHFAFSIEVTGTGVSIACDRCGQSLTTERALTAELARSVVGRMRADHRDRCVPRQQVDDSS